MSKICFFACCLVKGTKMPLNTQFLDVFGLTLRNLQQDSLNGPLNLSL